MKKICILFIIASALLISPISAALGAAQDEITVTYDRYHPIYNSMGNGGYPLIFGAGEAPRIVQGRVLLPLRRLAEHFGYKVDFYQESDAIRLSDEMGKTMELTLGQKQATVNGRNVLIDVPAEAVNGVTFVPLRFIAESFDMVVDWQPATRTVRISDYVISTPKYVLNLREKTLLLRGAPDEAQILVADLSKTEPAARWDNVRMTVTATAHGNDVVVVRNNYGEPHLWNDSHYLYVTDGKVAAQSISEGAMLGSSFSGVSADGKLVILSDGRKAALYDDQTLQVIAQYDLQDLCAGVYDSIPIDTERWDKDPAYGIFGFSDNYLLLFGAFNQLAMVVYPASGLVDVVYKEVFTPQEQELFEKGYIEGPMGADLIRMSYIGEEDGALIFVCNLENISGRAKEYRYRIK